MKVTGNNIIAFGPKKHVKGNNLLVISKYKMDIGFKALD
jgi:hypothetical protein